MSEQPTATHEQVELPFDEDGDVPEIKKGGDFIDQPNEEVTGE